MQRRVRERIVGVLRAARVDLARRNHHDVARIQPVLHAAIPQRTNAAQDDAEREILVCVRRKALRAVARAHQLARHAGRQRQPDDVRAISVRLYPVTTHATYAGLCGKRSRIYKTTFHGPACFDAHTVLDTTIWNVNPMRLSNDPAAVSARASRRLIALTIAVGLAGCAKPGETTSSSNGALDPATVEQGKKIFRDDDVRRRDLLDGHVADARSHREER